MIILFSLNEMKVNTDKFQLIIFNRQMTKNVSIHVDGYAIKNENVVINKLFGLYINCRAHVDRKHALPYVFNDFNASYKSCL